MDLFPGPLVIPGTTDYTRLGLGPEATIDEIRAATNRLGQRLRREGASESELTAANAIRLESVTDREAYDEAHPPLSLLKIRATTHPVLADDSLVAHLLRRELEEFLTARGAPVYRPSDLTRTDFTSDHAHHPLLDGS